VRRAPLVGASLTSAPASGAQILEPDAEPAPGAASAAPPSTQAQRDGRDIYLPNHVESVSHIALDVSRRSWLLRVWRLLQGQRLRWLLRCGLADSE